MFPCTTSEACKGTGAWTADASLNSYARFEGDEEVAQPRAQLIQTRLESNTVRPYTSLLNLNGILARRTKRMCEADQSIKVRSECSNNVLNTPTLASLSHHLRTDPNMQKSQDHLTNPSIYDRLKLVNDTEFWNERGAMS